MDEKREDPFDTAQRDMPAPEPKTMAHPNHEKFVSQLQAELAYLREKGVVGAEGGDVKTN